MFDKQIKTCWWSSINRDPVSRPDKESDLIWADHEHKPLKHLSNYNDKEKKTSQIILYTYKSNFIYSMCMCIYGE